MTKSVSEIHLSKVGKISDKWQSYLNVYDILFQQIKNLPIALLEIGVQNGGSLETWSEYFQYGKIFVGCDIDNNCGDLIFLDSRINIIVGDANTESAYNKIRSLKEKYDIIIDDGSHISGDILSSFFIYFPILTPGGVYVIEDTHTLYQNSFGGGILNEIGGMNFFKKLVDLLSYQFWANDLSPNLLFRTFFDGNSIPQFMAEGWVESIEFRNSMIIIRKSISPGHDKLGKRMITGSELTVKDQHWLNMIKS